MLIGVSKMEMKASGHLTYLPAHKYTRVGEKGEGRCSALAGRSRCRGDFCSFRIRPVLEGRETRCPDINTEAYPHLAFFKGSQEQRTNFFNAINFLKD